MIPLERSASRAISWRNCNSLWVLISRFTAKTQVPLAVSTYPTYQPTCGETLVAHPVLARIECCGDCSTALADVCAGHFIVHASVQRRFRHHSVRSGDCYPCPWTVVSPIPPTGHAQLTTYVLLQIPQLGNRYRPPRAFADGRSLSPQERIHR